VCNHQSDIDNNIVSAALLGVNFKCVIKQELLYYPFIGSAFYLVGHIPVKRGDRDSGRRAMERAAWYLRAGAHMFFFPEGTRKITGETGPIGPLKPGAFKLASEAGVPIVPVTISGARGVMPMTGFRLGFGTVTVTVHPPVHTVGRSVESLMDEVRSAMLGDMREVDEVPLRPSKET
jgi:1-acyl-sn-glycerol-3-phosphate acyltransferase